MQENEILKKIHKIVKGITRVKNVYVTEKDLILDYITIFSQSPSEFDNLVLAGRQLGDQIDEHNGPVFKLNKPIKFSNGLLKIFRVRKPDLKRPQVGCGDFRVLNYPEFKRKYLNKKNFQLFKGQGFEFLGIHDLKQDYLVYFPDIPLTKDLKL